MRLTSVSVFVLLLLVSGCANRHDAEMAKAHYDAQSYIASRPIVSMEAVPGQTIELKGVRTFEVFGSSGSNMSQYQQQHHPAWGILGDTMRVAAPAFIGGYWATELADTVGKRAGKRIGGDYTGGDYDASGDSFSGDYVGGDFDGSTRGDEFGGDYDGSITDSTHEPTIVEQPEPIIVEPSYATGDNND